jgi:hypothetical protein
MKLQEIEREALGLSERERAQLVLSLVRRDAELETGSVEPMLHEEFVRRVREERGQ